MEQVIGQQTAEEGQEESPLDNLIRQLQHQQDGRLGSGNPAAGREITQHGSLVCLFVLV